MRGLLNNPSLALEAIKFQSGNFFKELTIVFTQMSKVSEKDLPDHDLTRQLSEVIKKHTGLTITTTIDAFGPAIMLPQLDRNHPLLSDLYRGFATSGDGLRMINEAGGLIRGSVDLKHSKVDGVFAHLGATLLFPAKMIVGGKFSPQELAAAALHEVGHFFTYCEMVTRTVTTNYVLAGLSKVLDGTEGADKREAVLVSVKNALKLKSLNAKKLAKERDKKVIEGVVIASVLRESRSELNSTNYDQTGFEYLSDEFAARHGAGRYLVTALDKLHQAPWWSWSNISYRGEVAYVAAECFKLLALFSGQVYFWVALLMVDSQPDEYDTPEARFRRLRNQIVEQMKAKKIPAALYATLKADLEAIDGVLANVRDKRQWFAVAVQAILPGLRHEWNQEKLQKELEGLAMNELFVKAQELRQAA